MDELGPVPLREPRSINMLPEKRKEGFSQQSIPSQVVLAQPTSDSGLGQPQVRGPTNGFSLPIVLNQRIKIRFRRLHARRGPSTGPGRERVTPLAAVSPSGK